MHDCKFQQNKNGNFRCEECDKLVSAKYVIIWLNVIHSNLNEGDSKIKKAFMDIINYLIGVGIRKKAE